MRKVLQRYKIKLKNRLLGFSCFFFSSRRRHTRYIGDWSSDVCSSDLGRRRSRAEPDVPIIHLLHDLDEALFSEYFIGNLAPQAACFPMRSNSESLPQINYPTVGHSQYASSM